MGSIAAHPFRYRRAGDLEAFSGAGLHPAILDNELDQFQPPGGRQRSVGMSNVRDEGLRGIN